MRSPSCTSILLGIKDLDQNHLVAVHTIPEPPLMLIRALGRRDLPHVVLSGLSRPGKRNTMHGVVELVVADGSSVAEAQWLALDPLHGTP